MIGRLRGTLSQVGPGGVVVDVSGVGYEVAMTPEAVADLPPIGDEVVVHTHLQVREDDMSLFGFTQSSDRDLFRIVISASGVGPRVAMALMATLRADQLRRAILTEDVGALSTAPGVGKRSAQKIILELRPKLAEREAEVVTGTGPAQVRQALEQLGYRPDEINDVVADLDGDLPVEAQIKSALKALGQARRA
ncbi:MAG TPA: Holliday junction branch migration protein RuvA [Acidimicrobiia bacterium]|nr:Holliday junction branch migration protein RuvA [Acidimicrobiia bacterium]